MVVLLSISPNNATWTIKSHYMHHKQTAKITNRTPLATNATLLTLIILAVLNANGRFISLEGLFSL